MMIRRQGAFATTTLERVAEIDRGDQVYADADADAGGHFMVPLPPLSASPSTTQTHNNIRTTTRHTRKPHPIQIQWKKIASLQAMNSPKTSA